MLHIKEAIIVEGKYDKMRLERICDSPIFTTDGFRIFKDSHKRSFLKSLAKTRGILVLTDSDRAGFLIRNYIKGVCGTENVKHAYIPEVFGKERRKALPSKEGKIGVEGIDCKTLEDVLRLFCSPVKRTEKITKIDLYDMGLYGGTDSAAARMKICKKLNIPVSLSVSAFTDAVNALFTRDEFFTLSGEILCMTDTDKD